MLARGQTNRPNQTTNNTKHPLIFETTIPWTKKSEVVSYVKKLQK